MHERTPYNLLFLMLLMLYTLPFSTSPAFSDSVPEDDNSTPDLQKTKFDKFGHSFAPVVGYDPTFGVVAGGAYFYEERRLGLHVDANTNFRQVYQLHYSYRHQFGDIWEHGWRGTLMKGFDPYYGEGGETTVGNYSQIWGLQTHNRFHFGIRTSPIFLMGAFLDLRTRSEEAGANSPVTRVGPDEQTAAVGLFQRLDTRKQKPGTLIAEGFLLESSVSHVPRKFTSAADQESFTQVEGDFIVYKEILEQILPDVVAAFSLRGGFTIGNPNYAFTYRLGGTNSLRGYLENRFRGKKYYLQQTEIRFPVIQPVGVAVFMGFGDASSTDFTDAKMAYGAGLRIGLPPDYVSQVRLDFGFARDQWGFFANFGQVF